ncbi:MFS general substrate transporter [Stipitochalara longipes BDJ]|nr:MFS general substrate transporter [Stipitochalara longipes BDJ]
MSHPTKSDGEAVTSTSLNEKPSGEAVAVNPINDELGVLFDIDSTELPPGYFLTPFFIGTMVASGLAVMSGVGIFGLIAPLLTIINNDLGPSPNYTWIALVYILTLGLGQLLVGRISDLFGRRWFFIGGQLMSLVGCIMGACATSIPILIGSSVLVGFSSAAQLSYNFALGELVPMKWRFYVTVYIYTCCLPFSGFGPSIAYAFVQHSKHTWRSCYYLFIGIDTACLLCYFFFYYPPTFGEKWVNKSKTQAIKDFDYVGLILFTGGLIVFLLGISWGGSYYPWKSVHVIVTIITGFFALVAFAIYELYVDLKEPLIPMHLFKNLPWVSDIWMLSCGASVYFCFSIIWPIMVFGLYTSDQTKGGLLCCVTGIGTNVGQIISGLATKKIRHQKYQVIVASTAMALFLACGAVETPYNQNTITALLFMGLFCMGWVDNLALTISGIAIADQAEIGTATGVGACMRQIVSTIASTIYTTVLSNRLSTTIPKEVPPKLIAAGLPASSVASFLGAVAVGTPEAFSDVVGLTSEIRVIGIVAYKVASAHAYQTVFLTGIAFSVLCILGACGSPSVDKYMTGSVVTTLHIKKDEEKVVAEN